VIAKDSSDFHLIEVEIKKYTTDWAVDCCYTRRAEPLATIFGEEGIGVSSTFSI
jgi:hypothetical protein